MNRKQEQDHVPKFNQDFVIKHTSREPLQFLIYNNTHKRGEIIIKTQTKIYIDSSELDMAITEPKDKVECRRLFLLNITMPSERGIVVLSVRVLTKSCMEK